MKQAFLVIIATSIVFSCAQQTTPTGGPKDEVPPVLLSTDPPNKQTHFSRETITLTFDEHVIVNNPREQLIITPSLPEQVELTAKKRTVTLELNNELQDSTTYTINFRESVQDITEKNPVENLQYVFSTGSYVDSLSITGVVTDLIKSAPIKDVTVALYSNPDTFNIFKHKPAYLTKASETGEFEIQNLKPGKYYVYAIADANRNLIADSKTEQYGFESSAIDLTPDTLPSVVIPLVKLDARDLKLTSARPSNTFFNIRTSKGLTDFTLRPADNEKVFISMYGEDQSNIRVYPVEATQDSIAATFQATDSIGFQIDSLIYIKYTTRTVTPERFNVTMQKPKIILANNTLEAEFTMTKPVVQINFDSLRFQIDSTQTITFAEEDITWNYKTGTFKLGKTLDAAIFEQETPSTQQRMTAEELQQGAAPKSKNQYTLNIGQGAFISIENDSSTAMQESVNVYKREDTSVLSVEVQTDAPNFIVQLLNKDFKLVRSVYNQNNIVFDNLLPGDYQIRVVIDENGNQKWDPGNYFKRIEPEPVKYYKSEKDLQTINIKANWELGPLLISY